MLPTVRDDGSPSPTKHLVFFVHGSCSDEKTWSDLLTRPRKDEKLSDRYEFRTYQYLSRPVFWSFTQRLPDISEIGGELRREIDTADGQLGEEAYIDVTLVRHTAPRLRPAI